MFSILSFLVLAGILFAVAVFFRNGNSRVSSLEKELANVQKRLSLVTDHAPIGIFLSSESGKLLSVNPRLASMFGYGSPSEMLSEIHDIGTQLHADPGERKTILESILKEGQVHSHILKCRKRDGSYLWLSMDAALSEKETDGDGHILEGFIIDVTESILDKDRFRRLAETDMLTSVKNRRCFSDILEAEITRQKRYPCDLSVLLLDIDHFKHVNDTWGHDGGDIILIALARTVESCIRATDTFARLGGEEFVLLLPETGKDGAMTIAERIRQAVENDLKVRVDADTVTITASLGVATSGGNLSGEEMIRRADSAMYQAKNMGRNQVQFFTLPD